MRSFQTVCLCLMAVVAVCTAEAPRYRFQQRQQLGRQELGAQDAPNEGGPYPAAGTRPGREFPLPTETDAPVEDGGVDGGEFDGPADISTSAPGPYAPAGWRPAGRLLRLPGGATSQRQQVQPNQVYGGPTLEYGAPEPTPSATDLGELETEASEAGETNETTDEPESELLPGAQLNANLKAGRQQKLQSLSKFERLQQLSPVAQSTDVYLGQAANGAYFQLPVGQLRAQPLNAGNLAVYPVGGSLVAAPASANLQQLQAIYPVGGTFVAAPSAAKLQQVVAAQPAVVSVQQQQQQPQFLYSSLVASPDAVSYSSQYQSSW